MQGQEKLTKYPSTRSRAKPLGIREVISYHLFLIMATWSIISNLFSMSATFLFFPD